MTIEVPPPDGPEPDGDPRGWMAGAPLLTCQRCRRCGTIWYFHRTLCPSCGAGDPATVVAGDRGVVAATTVVRRAPTPELRTLAPYRVVLVDMADGFRLMAHAGLAHAGLAHAGLGGEPGAGAGTVEIGDPVRIVFHDFAGRPVPLAIPLAIPLAVPDRR